MNDIFNILYNYFFNIYIYIYIYIYICARVRVQEIWPPIWSKSKRQPLYLAETRATFGVYLDVF
ncbi:MAG: hypothetical protein N7Q72_01205, partial [Spiroplasma sp. Tabriz.8]|nr:hypothetical protein [Spiroplasma sp. Tabriz.8]